MKLYARRLTVRLGDESTEQRWAFIPAEYGSPTEHAVGEVEWSEDPEMGPWVDRVVWRYEEAGRGPIRKTLPSKAFGTLVGARFDGDRLTLDASVWPRRSNADAAADAFEKYGLPRPVVLEGRVTWTKP